MCWEITDFYSQDRVLHAADETMVLGGCEDAASQDSAMDGYKMEGISYVKDQPEYLGYHRYVKSLWQPW